MFCKVKFFAVIIVLLSVCACGSMEKMYDDENYESLTNEVGTIQVISGGVITHTFKNAKIIYSSSDTQAMWIICNNKKYYLQGDCIIELN